MGAGSANRGLEKPTSARTQPADSMEPMFEAMSRGQRS